MHKIEFEQINHLYKDCVSAFDHRTLFSLIFNLNDYRRVYNAECRWQLVRCTIQWTLVSRTSRWRSIAQYKQFVAAFFKIKLNLWCFLSSSVNIGYGDEKINALFVSVMSRIAEIE